MVMAQLAPLPEAVPGADDLALADTRELRDEVVRRLRARRLVPLVALLAVFLLALGGIHVIERRGQTEIVADAEAEHGRLLESLHPNHFLVMNAKR